MTAARTRRLGESCMTVSVEKFAQKVFCGNPMAQRVPFYVAYEYGWAYSPMV